MGAPSLLHAPETVDSTALDGGAPTSEGWPSGKALVPKTSDGGQRRGGSTPSPSAIGWVAEWQGNGPLSRSPGYPGAGSTPAPSATQTAADVTLEGIASWVAPRYGRNYLAMRLPKGTHVTLSGPGGTWEAVVNDYGPAKRTGRIADIAVGRWEDICGVPRSLGLCRVTAVITKRAAIALPETDQEEP